MKNLLLLFLILLKIVTSDNINNKNNDIRDAFNLENSNIKVPKLNSIYDFVQEKKWNNEKFLNLKKITKFVTNFGNHLNNYEHIKSSDHYSMEKNKISPNRKSKPGLEKAGLVNLIELKQHEENGRFEDISGALNKDKLSLLCSSPKKRKSLLLVSTVDGQLTAIDYNSGNVLWSSTIGNDQSSLISSSLSKVDITANGQWMRLIPSLDGAIYKFDGESITPLPINADLLLHSSYRFNDDTVMTGGKASEVIGIDPETGEVKYSCSKSGCERSSLPTDSPLLVVTKESKVVRAVDLRSGEERWNFSVGQHFVQMVQAGCSIRDEYSDDTVDRLHFVLPEGLLNAEGTRGNVWMQKLPSPIVSAWKVTNQDAEQLDLFSNTSVPALVSENKGSSSDRTVSLYIGYHEDEFYVQESLSFKNKVSSSYSGDLSPNSNAENLPKLKWRPYLATGDLRTPVLAAEAKNFYPLMIEYEKNELNEVATKDMIHWVENGFYLFEEEESPCRNRPFSFFYKNNKSFQDFCPINNLDIVFRKFENKVFSIPIPLFCLLLIGCLSFSCTCVCRLQKIRTIFMIMLAWFFNMIFRLLQRAGVDLNIPLRNPIGTPANQSEASSGRSVELFDRRISENSDATIQPFLSRLTCEFTAIDCLGKGGFGYVFNAQHKVDATNYAIKRIKLPNRESSKVMREVYALAKLQHPHIVRYFSSWIETPPDDWESPFDALLSFGDASFDPDNWEESETASHVINSNKMQSILKLAGTSSCSDNVTFEDSLSASEDGDDSSSLSNGLSDDDSSSVMFVHSSSQSFEVVDRSGSACSVDPMPELGRAHRSTRNSNNNDSSVVFEHSSSRVSEHSSSRVSEASAPSGATLSRKLTLNSDCTAAGRRSRGQSEADNQRIYLYIQMELCKQNTLREWLEHNSCRDKSKIVRTFNDIVHAVEYIHDQNLIHRDLKPSNIFFSNDGHVKVGDFGLVTSIVDDVSQKMTKASIIMSKRTVKAGTELYMSPEQKEKRRYNHKVDIFSLGIIFYEMLVPFGTEMERRLILMKVRQRQFPAEFQDAFPKEFLMLNRTLNENAELRPTTRGLRALEPLADLQTDLHLIEEVDRHFLRTISHRKRLNSCNDHILL